MPPSLQDDPGLRSGDRGTHTSRTMMLAELGELFAAVPQDGTREDYARAVIQDNVLGKQTASNRRLTNQRLGELYALDPTVPVFRVLRRLWDIDRDARPLLALLCALARDPLLRATAPAVLALPQGQELLRSAMTDSIVAEVGDRLNPSILDKVARNAGSSWTQSGHLEGRVRKLRRRVQPTPATAAFALWLGAVQGGAGENLLRTFWARVLDASPGEMTDLALRAKQLGLLQTRIGGGVTEIDVRGLDPGWGGR